MIRRLNSLRQLPKVALNASGQWDFFRRKDEPAILVVNRYLPMISLGKLPDTLKTLSLSALLVPRDLIRRRQDVKLPIGNAIFNNLDDASIIYQTRMHFPRRISNCFAASGWKLLLHCFHFSTPFSFHVAIRDGQGPSSEGACNSSHTRSLSRARNYTAWLRGMYRKS